MVVFVDSNIPMYIIGERHPNKEIALRLIETFARNQTRLVTNSEVFQEILHRYSFLKKLEAIQPAWDVLENIVDEVIDITFEDVVLAKNILLAHKKLSSRDSLHVATMKRAKVSKILSFDKAFDLIPTLERIPS